MHCGGVPASPARKYDGTALNLDSSVYRLIIMIDAQR